MIDANFDKKELRYIRNMFKNDYPEVMKFTKASHLGGMVDIFVDNCQEAINIGEDWPLDRSIVQKVFAYHGIPKDTDYKTFYKKYRKMVEKNKVEV